MRLSADEKRLIEAAGWPEDLLCDRTAPRYVESPQEFAEALLLEDHLEDIVILPDGLRRTGLSPREALPAWLCDAASVGSAGSSVLRCLKRLGPHLESHKAALEFPDDKGVQREALPKPYPFCLWDDEGRVNADVATQMTMPESWRNLGQRVQAAEALLRKGELEESHLYACEMRRLREREANEFALDYGCEEGTKSLCLRHARDWLAQLSKWTMYWNCYDDGVFVGGRGSGKGLHVDQVLWSNVGKQWQGYKLMVTWPAGSESTRLVREMGDAHFRAPLEEQQLAALRCAARIALLRPGDLFICSGGVAHATLSVSEELTITGYESLVTLHPRLVEHMLHTGSSCGPCALDKGVMESDELKEMRQGMLKRSASSFGSPPAALPEPSREISKEQSAPASGLVQSGRLGEPVALPAAGLRELLATAARQVGYDPSFAVLCGSAGVSRLLAASDRLQATGTKRRRTMESKDM
ncbi:unnamed protein product [Effrenium voratum]|uniref:JmjC domain-containing protein n=1 Tax=Effrenium voratum TaxID=2562239 RepID=A0AA36IGX7_9DINO|nr:unnamed protein product [Effrenium voratum]CAJ1421866.1 unnamed protein product [Effrenium voratum]